MQIANPIYDVVFKYLMQNNEIAILILSTILDEEIMALDLLPQEISMTLGNRFFTVCWLDFSARIKTRDGAVKQVVIEIQKAKFAADIMRFRRYLGEHYEQGFMLASGSKVQQAIPIISIYFLGYQLEHVQVPVIKVLRNYYDAATGQAISAREEFIESLTHDSFVIQIPYLGPEYKTAAGRLLAIFDQHLKVSSDEHILDIDEAAYPQEYRQVVRWLNRAITEPKIRQTMDVEDDILAELEDMERQIAGMGQALEEKDKVIGEQGKALEEKDRLIAGLRQKKSELTTNHANPHK
ncbi:hypothetical protein [Candidatus Thiosymbion oneisti]|uniref:hypothetical protein n=1 Tax=Candidatus Thiosymbion oneisti TaxID=589554 RepID=UPI000B0F5F62|nr:hypothetical protein [Candidatus Thiosymbion oneisti]